MVDNVFIVMVGPNVMGLAPSPVSFMQRRRACCCRPTNMRRVVRGVLFRGDVAAPPSRRLRLVSSRRIAHSNERLLKRGSGEVE